MKFCCFIYVLLLWIINSADKALSVDNWCEKKTKIQPSFAEIFGQKWEKNQNENWQNYQNDLNSTVSIGNNQNNNQFRDQQNYKIIHKFHAIKEGIKKRRKYSSKDWNKIEQKIAKKFGISVKKIYKIKKELEIYEKNYYQNKKKEFIDRIEEFKRMYKNGKQKQFAEELGIGEKTFYNWKKEFGIKMIKRVHSSEEKMSKMNDYLKMKNENPSLMDKEICAFLKISQGTLTRWKKEIN